MGRNTPWEPGNVILNSVIKSKKHNLKRNSILHAGIFVVVELDMDKGYITWDYRMFPLIHRYIYIYIV